MLDNTTITATRKTMPWGDKAVVATYSKESDPRLSGYSAMVITDSSISGVEFECDADRLVTMIVRFPRCILSEMNTHRVFSRNSASSRARSLKTTIKQVLEDPYIPLFTENAKGMQGNLITDDIQLSMARKEWLFARDSAVKHAMRMLLGDDIDRVTRIDPKQRRVSCISHSYPSLQSSLDMYYTDYYGKGNDIPDIIPNVHKQTVNRLLEPFMWHEMLITSSYWENFFRLRTDEAAQPEMQAIAQLMYVAYHESNPVHRELHIPFVSSEKVANMSLFGYIREAFMQSAAECARISYHDRSTMTSNGNSDLALRLLSQGHMSPFEHQAIGRIYLNRLAYRDNGQLLDDWGRSMSGNLALEWCQYRKIIEAERTAERPLFLPTSEEKTNVSE